MLTSTMKTQVEDIVMDWEGMKYFFMHARQGIKAYYKQYSSPPQTALLYYVCNSNDIKGIN